MALNDITRVLIRTALFSQLGLIVRHYRHSAIDGTGTTHQAIADALQFSLSATLLPLLTSQASFLGVTAQKIEPLPASIPFASSSPPLPGTGGPNTLPGQVSAIITLRSNNAGRRNRGRSYVPFPSEERNTDGKPTATYVADLTQLGTALIMARVIGPTLANETLTPIIYRRNFTPRTIDIQSFVARPVWATQRRRGDYGQANIVI